MSQTKFFDSIGKGLPAIQINGANNTDNAGLAAIPNPENEPIIIIRAFLHIRNPSTGGANLNVGIAADKVSAATDIINALAVDGAIDEKTYNAFATIVAAKTELAAPVLWTADKFLTVTGSADTTGLDAVLFIEYIRVGVKES